MAEKCTGSALLVRNMMPVPGTDFDAIRRGAVSVTPLQIDLTSYKAMDGVAEWLQGAFS